MFRLTLLGVGAMNSPRFPPAGLLVEHNPQSRTFTIALPIVFLVIFAAIFEGSTIVDGRAIKLTTYYVPGIMTLGISSASFVNLTVAIVTQREAGVLKRARATPVPAGVVIPSRAAVGVLIALAMSGLLLAIWRLGYGVELPDSTMPGLIVAVVIGAASFCWDWLSATRHLQVDAPDRLTPHTCGPRAPPGVSRPPCPRSSRSTFSRRDCAA